ncbi:hypothetical protein [Arsukibacterium sp.]|uniref:hypothetical protein n=1 Tax=Arsukibacterium sp. TaxID=1977258 RepID=UPI00299DAC5D|nr:hypothetical protein [Arsukibacterium sp.]MDX1536403.1 hypothetical protein [Arsukibacterium sp.]
MSDPVVYKSTDVGAPTLDRTAGSWVNVLRKVLVDGYGSKSAAGWSMSTISANQQNAIFKPNVLGGWLYLVYDDHRNTHVTDKMALMAAIDSYTDVETYASPLTYSSWISRIPENAGSNQGLIKPESGKWCIIANDKTAYIFTDRLNNSDLNYNVAAHVIGSVSNLGAVARQVLMGANPYHITGAACQLGYLDADGFCLVGTRMPISESAAGGIAYLNGVDAVKKSVFALGPGVFNDGYYAQFPICRSNGRPECMLPGLLTCLYKQSAAPELFSEDVATGGYLLAYPFAVAKAGWLL